jgi:hypothetical protein
MTRSCITTTHHVGVAFRCDAETVWREIGALADGSKFARQGFEVEPITDDPRAYLGGYRMVQRHADRIDERLCFVTERDETARRLSVCAYYVGSIAQGVVVQATYSALAGEQGSVYQIDCHGTQDVEIPSGSTTAGIAAMMAASTQAMNEALRAMLEADRDRLEARAG